MKRIWAVLVALSLSAVVEVAFAAGVNDQFNKARVMFDRGQLASSRKQLRRILKRYPNHAPSLFFMGRIAVRTGNASRAVSLFRQAGREFAEGDGAMDYGIAFYQAREFRESLWAFSQVRDPRLRDLAHYYEGLSYYRLGDYVSADRTLRRARSIPLGKAEIRDQTLQEIQARMAQGIFSGPAEQAPMTPVAPAIPAPGAGAPAPAFPLSNSPPPAQQNNSAPERKMLAERPVKPKIGTHNVATPRIKFYRTDEQVNFSGAQKEESSVQGVQLGVNDTVYYWFKPDRHDNQSNLSLGLDGAYVTETTDGRKVKYYAAPSEEGAFYYADEQDTNKSGVRGEVKFVPGFAAAVTKATTASGSYELFQQFPDFAADESKGTRTPSISIASRLGSVPLTSDLKYKESQSKGETYRQDLIFSLGIAPAFSFLSLSAKGGYKTSTDPRGTPLEGPATATSVDLAAIKTLEFGISLTVGVGVAKLGNYTKTGLKRTSTTTSPTTTSPSTGSSTGSSGASDAGETGSAEATRQTLSGTIDVAPLDWISGSIGISTNQTDYEVSDPGLEASYLQNATSGGSTFSMSLTISKSF